jgi:hypothetical protein
MKSTVPSPALWTAALLVALALVFRLPASSSEPEALREAIGRSLPLIASSAKLAIAERSNCFTCHHSGLPAMAFLAAREKGVAGFEEALAEQLRFTAGVLAKDRERYAEGRGPGGAAFGAGSALWALRLGGWPGDEVTGTVADYILRHQFDKDFWTPPSTRPPAEESPFSATYVAVESLRGYGGDLDEKRLGNRLGRARAWLERSPAQTTEDRVFRLLALASAGSEADQVSAAAAELRAGQREDGGWGQLDELGTDAYATGTALVALAWTDESSRDDRAWRSGIDWLLRDQLPDGSWKVRSRADPFQKYFESGYPHGADQFLSITAACWATVALLHALP